MLHLFSLVSLYIFFRSYVTVVVLILFQCRFKFSLIFNKVLFIFIYTGITCSVVISYQSSFELLLNTKKTIVQFQFLKYRKLLISHSFLKKMTISYFLELHHELQNCNGRPVKRNGYKLWYAESVKNYNSVIKLE